MTSAMPELGSKISLISKQLGIRYQGTLVAFDAQKNTIALMNVLSFGTENRDTQFPVVPQNQVYEYILFRASDIRDIRVMTVQQAPIGQQTYQMMPGMAGPASSIPGFPGAYPMSVGGGGGGHIMMANNARPQNQHVYNHSVTDVLDLSGSGGGGGGGSRSKTPPPSLTASKSPSIGQPTYQMIPTPNNPHSMMPGMAGPASSIPGFPGAYPMSMGGGGGGHNMMANNARPQNQHIMNNNQINKAPSLLDLISGGGGGGSRSNTPTPSLITRKSPSIDQATQAGHQQRVGKIGEKTTNRNAHQNQHQQHRDGPRGRSGSALSQYSDTKHQNPRRHLEYPIDTPAFQRFFTCPYCFFLMDPDFARGHLDDYHKRPLVCKVCFNMATNRNRLNEHENSHSILTQHFYYQCVFCDLKYPDKGQLYQHISNSHAERVEAFNWI
ncbi:hypothetical protein HCN44_002619 [Aphidius gifuensis]|uniref:Sm domain-containing protein n=1 Tax=Aphidius gifuensis TaxID=684658 RepID=A0A834XSY0_APHGI|nr:hypothetical protein HCN44_002619 [Aphidius gifuensis]